MTSELKTTIEQIDPAKPFEVSTPETAMELFKPVTEELRVIEIQGYRKLTLEVNGFEKVKACRILAKKARCAVTNRQKELTEGAKIYQNNVNYAAKKIIGLIEPVETYLEGEEEKHRLILVEQEKKEAEKKAKVLQDRCDRLAKAGCQAGNLVALGNMTDELFEWHLKDQAEKEAERVEAARVKAEQQQKEDAEKAARIAAEQAEREAAVRKRQEELRAEAARLAAENERLKAEAAAVVAAVAPVAPSSPAEEEEDFELDCGSYPNVDWGTGDSIHVEAEIIQEIHQEPFPSPAFRPIPEPVQPVQQQKPPEKPPEFQQPKPQPQQKQCIIERLNYAENIARANHKEGIADLLQDARLEIVRLRIIIDHQ